MEKKKAKIAVAIHSCGPVEPMAYTNHISVFSSWAKEHHLLLLTLDRAKVADARNALVGMALEQECTHILFIDTDHIVDDSMLGCLLGNDTDVVSGLVVRKVEDDSQVGFVKKDGMYYSLRLPTNGMSYAVDACAFGCTLIKMDVFKDIVTPYFKDVIETLKDGTLKQKRSDIKFCDDVKALGKTIRIDTRVIVGHLGHGIVHYPVSREYQLATYKIAAELICEHDLKSTIDLGCGYGKKLVKYIVPICDTITGVDDVGSIKYCKAIHSKHNITWEMADFELEYDNVGKFDLVICADVLEHIKDYKRLLGTITNCMHDKSYAVISTPDVDTVTDEIETNADHKQFWNKQEFIDIANENGLVVEDTKYKKEMVGYMSTICVCRKAK